MEENKILELYRGIQEGRLSLEETKALLQDESMGNLGYANIDYDRKKRRGVQEVIYGAGKSKEQILGIVLNMLEHKGKNILITRMSKEAADYVKEGLGGRIDYYYHDLAKLAIVNWEKKEGIGSIVVVSAGTSDLGVCEEAALTAEVLGNKVTRVYDVGVAGIHRLFAKMDILKEAKVLIVVAGMEGALASVVGGLTSKPIIAVPTSVGYGANFGGLSALLSMLNSCASGVSVVNIDNGFGAAYSASMINHMCCEN